MPKNRVPAVTLDIHNLQHIEIENHCLLLSYTCASYTMCIQIVYVTLKLTICDLSVLYRIFAHCNCIGTTTVAN